MKYLDPKNELTINKVFGQNPKLCKSLINSLLPQSGSFYAEEVRVIPDFDAFVYPVFRTPSVVLDCKGRDGKRFIVMFQLMWTNGFLQSVLFDSDKAYIRYQKEIEAPESSVPVIGIALINDVFEYEKDHYYHYFADVEEAHTGREIKGLSYVFVELAKFADRKNESDTLQARWLNFFHMLDESTIAPPALLTENPDVAQAVTLCHVDAYSEKELFEYRKNKAVAEIKLGIRSEAEEEGFKRGVEKGIEVGLEKGFARGYQKGNVAAVRQLALKALQMGISPELVLQVTELNQMTVDNLVNLIGEFGSKAAMHLGD